MSQSQQQPMMPAAFLQQPRPGFPRFRPVTPDREGPLFERKVTKICNNCETVTSHCNNDVQNCPVLLDLMLTEEQNEIKERTQLAAREFP